MAMYGEKSQRVNELLELVFGIEQLIEKNLGGGEKKKIFGKKNFSKIKPPRKK